MVSCRIEEGHPLNFSDHLCIISKLKLSLLTSASTSSDHIALDWTSAIRNGCIPQYASLTESDYMYVVVPFLNKGYSSMEEIKADISHVSKLLIDSSLFTIPLLKSPKKLKSCV